MTIKTILAFLPTQTAAPAVLTAARIIAEPRGGFVTGIHLTQAFPAFREFATEIYEVRQKQSEAAQAEAAAIEELLDQRAQQTTVPHEWKNHTVPYKLGVEFMVDAARTADLVIFSQPEAAHAYWGDDLADLVLIQSGRPLLIVPPSFQDGRIGDRVVIAWNNIREAARAVFDSLDLIRDASSVRVITHIRDETERSAAEASNSAVVTALRCHVAHVSGEVGQVDGSGMSCRAGARRTEGTPSARASL